MVTDLHHTVTVRQTSQESTSGKSQLVMGGACTKTPAGPRNVHETMVMSTISSTSSSTKPPPPQDAAAAGTEQPASVLLHSEESFNKRFEVKTLLGSGNYSTVKKALDLTTNEAVAVKIVDSRTLTKDDLAALHVEVEILAKLRHPNVIKFIAWYQEGPVFNIVTELMSGGELFDRIVQKEFYSEADAQKVVVTLASVMKFIQDQGFVHRDLKPENILLKDQSENALIKIADFGFAKPVGKGLTTACGTPGYVAPEIISGKTYGKSVDVWSFGVIIYILLCGYPPFYNSNQQQLFKAIREGRFTFDSPYWDPISTEAKSMISGCLTVDATKRLTFNGILSHPWLASEGQSTDITGALSELKKFNARRKLRVAIKAAIAANRMRDIVAVVRMEMEHAKN